jgi:hypothetical protein
MRAHTWQTIGARTAPWPLAFRALLAILPLLAALSLAPALTTRATLDAQTVVRAGSRSVSMIATARLVIGVRLHARQVGAVVHGTRSEGFTEVAIPVEAAANLAWRLAVAAPRTDAGAERGAILVLDEQGAWVPLPADGGAEVAVAGGEPTNPAPRMLRFRVADAADIALVERLRLVMQPAVGAP